MWKALSIEDSRNYFQQRGENPECSVEYCKRERLVIENKNNKNLKKAFDKCIFHVEKTNEYWIENYKRYKEGKEEAKWNRELVREFWRLVREYREVDVSEDHWGIKRGNMYNFVEFVFPEFEEIDGIYLSQEGDKLKFLVNWNFWRKGEYAEFAGNVSFWGVQFSGNVDFKEARFTGNVSFWGVQFSGKADFKKTQFTKYVGFWGTRFAGKVDFGETQFTGNVSFWGVQFSGNVDFKEARFTGNVSFWGVQFSGKADFKKTQFTGLVFFIGTQFTGNVYFWGTQFTGYAYFNGTQFAGNVSFDGTQFAVNVSFNEIQFLRNVSFYRAQFFQNLNLSARCKQTEINFKDARIDHLSNITISIEGTVNNGNSSSGSKLKIIFPNVSKNFMVIDSDFSGFDEVCFEGNIEDVRFINVNWGDVTSDRYCPDVSDIRKMRDIYRQIKLALDKQENYIDARKFYALEMKAYGRETKHLSEKIIYYLYRYSSEFGMSWVRPLIWILIITLFYWALKYWKIYEFLWEKLSHCSLDPACYFETFLLMLDILVKTITFFISERFQEDSTAVEIMKASMRKNEGMEFVSYIYYIVITYLIYQIVVAIRTKVRR